MNAEEPLPDESILPQLRACDEALAAGASLQEYPVNETPVELRPRLEGNLACIQVLRQVLPRRGPAAVSAEDIPFQRLGRFQVRRELGHGTFGMVFLAFDPLLGREVALKLPRPEVLLTGELRERFLREARAAAGLDHPNLVPVHEAGEVGPLCYIASAYCPGITLDEWLKERAQLAPERLSAALVATLADAVGHAHTRGVIHRDLKPSNVLLQGKGRDPAGASSTVKEPGCGNDSEGTDGDFIPRITDFGLAKFSANATAQLGEAVGAATHSGAVLGTPNYMAPEQASGKNKEIGPAADVYALGVILYELLTGRPPFRGESILDTLEQVRTREPLPPGRLRPKLARDLETIYLKCLQKEPRRRYESARALAEDLRRCLAGEPIQARPIRTWERGIKWARRRPALALLLGFSILAPSVLLGVVLGYNARLRSALAAKEEKQREANENFRLARSAVDDYATKVSQDKRLRAHDLEGLRKELLQSALTFYRRFIQERSEDLDLQHEQAAALRRMGDVLLEVDSKQEAIDALQEAVAIYRKIAESDPENPQYQLDLSLGLSRLASAYGMVPMYDLCEATCSDARNILQRLIQTHPSAPEYQSALAESQNLLGNLFRNTGRPRLAETAYGEARENWAKLLRDHPRDEHYQSSLARCYRNLGYIFETTNRQAEAEQAYRRSSELGRSLVLDHPGIPDHQDDLAGALTSLGIVFEGTGRPEQALAPYMEAQKIEEKLVADHPKIPKYKNNLARIYTNLGIVQERLGQPDLAEKAYDGARKLRQRLIHDYPDSLDYRIGQARTLKILGFFFRKSGRAEKARPPLLEARRFYEKLTQDFPEIIDFQAELSETYCNLGQLASMQNDEQTALSWYDQTVSRLVAVLKKEPRHTFARQCFDEVRVFRVISLGQLGKYSEAMSEIDAMSAESSITAVALYNLACACSLCSAAARRNSHLAREEQDSRAEQFASRAIGFLKKAKAAGYFESAAQLAEMRKDKDLDALRPRGDFQELILSLQSKK